MNGESTQKKTKKTQGSRVGTVPLDRKTNTDLNTQEKIIIIGGTNHFHQKHPIHQDLLQNSGLAQNKWNVLLFLRKRRGATNNYTADTAGVTHITGTASIADVVPVVPI